jgi:hypothetical protein
VAPRAVATRARLFRPGTAGTRTAKSQAKMQAYLHGILLCIVCIYIMPNCRILRTKCLPQNTLQISHT